MNTRSKPWKTLVGTGFMIGLTLALAACAGISTPTPQSTVPQPTPTLAQVAAPDVTPTTAAGASVLGLRQVYEDEAAGFSLRLPEDWTVDEGQAAPYGTLYQLGATPLNEAGPNNSSIIVADNTQITPSQLAEQILCGGGCPAPTLTDVTLRNNIPAQFAQIGGEGAPLQPWYFIEQNDILIALSIHNPDRPEEALEAIAQSFTPGSILESGGEEFAAAQAARQALAQELGIHPYAILLDSVISVEWPDACLGVEQADQVCAQVITPGYTVILTTIDPESRVEQQVQYNTNEDGSVVVRAPDPVAPVASLGQSLLTGSMP